MAIDGVAYLPNRPRVAPISVCMSTTSCSTIKTPWLRVVRPESQPRRRQQPVIFDPVLALDAVRKASVGGLAQVGSVRLSGIETTEYTGRVTAGSLDRIRTSPRVFGIWEALLIPFYESSYAVPPVPETKLSSRVTIWVDRQRRARKIEVDWLNHRQTVTFGAFGKPVSLAPPNARDITTIKAKVGQFCTINIPPTRATSDCRVYAT